jgi:hypothetical protein
LLKLGAGLTLAASTPAIANAEPDLVESTALAPGEGPLAGVWHSKYVYYSNGRAAHFEGEHYVVLRQRGDHISAQSLPNSLDSVLTLDLTADGPVLTGKWMERTSSLDTTRALCTTGLSNCSSTPRVVACRGSGWVSTRSRILTVGCGSCRE